MRAPPLLLLLAGCAAAAAAETRKEKLAVTSRPNPLEGLAPYEGGFNPSGTGSGDYWASLAWTGAAGFILGAFFFVCWEVVFVVRVCCRCCKPKDGKVNGRKWPWIVLAVLGLALAIVSGILISVGTDGFAKGVDDLTTAVLGTARSVTNAVDAINKALVSANDSAVGSGSSDLADITKTTADFANAAKDVLTEAEKYKKNVEDVLESAVFYVAIGLVVLGIYATLGTSASFSGRGCCTASVFNVALFLTPLVLLLIWVLFGVFAIIHNLFDDTCTAAGEYVEAVKANHATELSDVIPCIDGSSTADVVAESRKVIVSATGGLNEALTAAHSVPGFAGTKKLVCVPFEGAPPYKAQPCPHGDLHTVPIGEFETAYAGSSYQSAVPSDQWNTLVLSAQATDTLIQTLPTLANLANCTDVRDFFDKISKDICRDGLVDPTGMIYSGFGLLSVSLALLPILWILARPRFMPDPEGRPDSSRPDATQFVTASAVSLKPGTDAV